MCHTKLAFIFNSKRSKRQKSMSKSSSFGNSTPSKKQLFHVQMAEDSITSHFLTQQTEPKWAKRLEDKLLTKMCDMSN